TAVADDAVLEVAASDHYVSRAAHKLIAALDAFRIDPAGRVALDMGASTGGFTQVLRERGAEPVIAVDVGHGQLAASIAADPAVACVEGFNVRYMTPGSLAAASGVTTAPSIVTGDLSFISLSHVLPAAYAVAAPGADLVLLIKPQFEAGRTAVRGGLVTDPATRADAVAGVLWSACDASLGVLGLIASPIPGTHGNAEFVVHLGRDHGGNPTEWVSTVNRLAGAR
ncbi:MAG: TlyA family RNA methyltransferase, partial [Microbacterium sp.]